MAVIRTRPVRVDLDESTWIELRPFLRQSDQMDVTDEVSAFQGTPSQRGRWLRAVVQRMLLGWNVVDQDGAPVPVSIVGELSLSDPLYQRIRDAVVEILEEPADPFGSTPISPPF